MKHSAQLKGQFSYNKFQVLFLTKMSEEQYTNFQVDTALAWLERYYPEINAEALLSTQSCINWWQYMWNLVDDEWILGDLYILNDQSGHLYLYRQLHQYVFDDSDTHQNRLMADFRGMRYDFEKELKLQKT